MQSLPQSMQHCTEAGILGLRRAIEAGPGWRLLLLCDPSIDDPLRAQARSRQLTLHPVDLQPCASPVPALYLIDIGAESQHESFVHLSLRTAVAQALLPQPASRRSRSICAWLLTSLTPSVLAQRLAQRSRPRAAMPPSSLFRFWDPRSSQHLPRLLPGIPPGSWIASSSWGFIDSFGHWQLLPWRPEHPLAHVEAMPAPATAAHYSLLNHVLQHLSAQGMHASAAIFDAIEQALQIGAAQGLQDADDLCSFASQRLIYRQAIEHLPWIAGLLAQARRGEMSYHHGTCGLDEQAWAEVLQARPVRPLAPAGDPS